nr:hypothetical protein CFP56_05207 [Quercus suber]
MSFQQQHMRSREEEAELAFSFNRIVEDDEESDSDLDELVEDMVDVHLSKETKARMRAPWAKALIVKVFGRTVGYKYLTFKINTLWKPSARMDCVDLGKDFFLIKFSDDADYDKVLKGGPWFIGEHFLATRPWVPYFKASEATFDAAIGPVLRIDSYTATGERASYARLCIQINLMKPLITTVRVGKLRQKVLYEGISALCFYCGRLGHKQETCNFRVASPERTGKDALPTQSSGSQEATQTESRFGEWMLVKKKKRSVQNGKGRGTRILNQQDVSSKATKGLDSHLHNSLTIFRPDVTLKFNMGQAAIAVGASSSLKPCDKGCHTQPSPMEKSEVRLRTANDVLIFQSPQKVDS